MSEMRNRWTLREWLKINDFFSFIRRLCGCNGGKTTNTLILILLFTVLGLQIFGGKKSKESFKRSLTEPSGHILSAYDGLEYSDAKFEDFASGECEIQKTNKICDYLSPALIGHQEINASFTVPPDQSIANR